MNIEITEITEKTQNPTICLNMIVKDESKIIEETLINLSQFFIFDYYVICDTGSSDNTKEIIYNFFEKKGISGELLDYKWRDFAYNRTTALNVAFNKSDYILIADADDRIYGDLILPRLTKDKYNLKFGKEFTYMRPNLITNRKKWKYKGVVHEFLTNIDPVESEENIKGDYYFGIGTFGARSVDPDKYLKDAYLLEREFEVEDDEGLKNRYAFYCAQSFMDSGETLKAIEWYQKVLTLKNWNQEKYYACYKLGQLYLQINKKDEAINIWFQAYKYDIERLDCISGLMAIYYEKENHLLVSSLYNKYKNYNKAKIEDKLFLDIESFDKLEYYNSISAFYVNDFKGGYNSCKKLIINEKYLNIVIKNMQFYLDELDKDNDISEFYSAIKKIELYLDNFDTDVKEVFIKIKNLLYNKT